MNIHCMELGKVPFTSIQMHPKCVQDQANASHTWIGRPVKTVAEKRACIHDSFLNGTEQFEQRNFSQYFEDGIIKAVFDCLVPETKYAAHALCLDTACYLTVSRVYLLAGVTSSSGAQPGTNLSTGLQATCDLFYWLRCVLRTTPCDRLTAILLSWRMLDES